MSDSGITTPPAPPAVPAGYKSQEEINRIAAAEKEEGKRSATNALLKILGVKDEDELKALAKKMKEADDATLSEVAKLTGKVTKLEADLETEKSARAKAEDQTRVFKILVEQGAPAATMDDIKQLLRLDDGADEAKITTAVSELKTRLPALFEVPKEGEGGEEGTGTTKPPAVPNPGAPKKDPPKPDDRQAQALSILHRRHPNTAKAKP